MAVTNRQIGKATIASGSTSETKSVGGGDITNFDPTGTILIASQSGGGAAPSTALIRYVKASDGNSITFYRDGTGSSIDLEYTLLEMDNITVTDISNSDLTDGESIPFGKTVDLTETFIISSFAQGGSSYTKDDQPRITLDSATGGTFHLGDAAGGAGMEGEFQLVECDDVIVEEVTHAEDMTTDSTTITIADTSGDERMMFATKETADSTHVHRFMMYRLEFTGVDDDEVTATREDSASNDDMTMTLHILRWQDATTCQYHIVDFPTADTSETTVGGGTDYDTVDEDRSLILPQCSQTALSTGEARRHDDDFRDNCARHYFSGGGGLDGSEITSARGNSGNTNDLQVGIAIVQFPEPAAGGGSIAVLRRRREAA